VNQNKENKANEEAPLDGRSNWL